MMEHKQRLPSEQRQAHAIQAVIHMAAEKSPNEITTSAIAQYMGLSQGAIFKHFPNKDAILSAVMEWVANSLLSKVDKAAQDKAALPALEAVMLAHVHFVKSKPGIPRMLFGELQRAKDTPAKKMAKTLMTRYGQRIAGLIEQGKSSGEIDSSIQSSSAATMFIGVIQGLVMQSMLAGHLEDIEQSAADAFQIFKRGIETL